MRVRPDLLAAHCHPGSDTMTSTTEQPQPTAVRGGPAHARHAPAPRAVAMWPVLLAAACSAIVTGYALSLPNILTGVHGVSGHGYDDGVYFSAAVNLVNGRLPYSQFVVLHPPGIMLLMAPVALLGHLIGERDAFVLSRCITALVAVANAGLAAFLLRRRGTAAMAIGGVSLALFPLSVTATHTLMLEPYLVLCCLGGLLCAFDGARFASNRRLLCAGALFGVAGTVKIWAILPVVAVLAVLVFRSRHVIGAFLAGLVVGFVVPVVPFLLAAPSAFVHDTATTQSGRISVSAIGSQLGAKLLAVTGLSGLGSAAPPGAVAVVAAVVLAAVVVGVFVVWRAELTDLDLVVACSAVVVVVGMLSTTQFYAHYAYFTAAFLALVLGTTAGLVVPSASRALGRPRRGDARRAGRTAIVACAAGAVTLVALLVVADTAYARSYLSASEDPGATLAAVIPAGSCVVSDQVSNLLDANRLVPSSPGCPSMVDWYGTWLAQDPGVSPEGFGPFSTQLVSTWVSLLQRADYLEFFSPQTAAYPRTGATQVLLGQYRLVYQAPGLYLYCHLDGQASSVAATSATLDAGIAAQGRGDLGAATSAYDHVLLERPCSAVALFDLGTVHQAAGDAAGAMALYREVLAMHPGYVPAKQNLAFLQRRARR